MCLLFSDVKTLEVHTILGSENHGSVHYFRIGKPWKCMYTIFGSKNPGGAYYFRDWQPWKCILVSDLKTLEVHTIFGSENAKPWKCILFVDLKTLEVYTIFGSGNHRSVYYFRI